MPDDSMSRRARGRAGAAREDATGGILPDQIDIRDRLYEPTLQRLAPELLPAPELIATLIDATSPFGLPRTQGAEGTCGGQAMAAMIDAERIRAGVSERYQASARMIYQMARLKTDDRWGEDGVSLRDVIKAFYNYGVCSDKEWPYVPTDDPTERGELNVARAREARKLSLGAYYRMRPNLNTYHAALHETGAVLVSAELHDGWLHENVKANGGAIVPPGRSDPPGRLASEKHAFVIVGYTPQGFLVLNSWGRGWGGWRPAPDADPVPGIALWQYADWADTIMDGWVLRLGVGAAEAFEYSIGDMGLGFGAEQTVRSTPVHAILGNFLHLDDGDFVRSGAFVSTQNTLKETLKLLKDDARSETPYQGVLLTFAGALHGLKEATDHVARWKRLVRDVRWYPFTVIWCSDYADQARGVLEGVFREAEGRAGRPGPVLDRTIEELANGVGRALWRDIERAARRGARIDGPLHALAGAWRELAAERPGLRLRVVAESEGVLALAALTRSMRLPVFAAEADPFFESLDSIDLIAPPLSNRDYLDLAKDLDGGWGAQRPDRGIRVHLPTGRDEKRLAVPPYGESYFELVRRAFQSRADIEREPAPIVCASRARSALAGKWDPWKQAPRTTLVPIAWPAGREPDAQGPIHQTQLIYRSDVGGRLRAVLGVAEPRRRSGAIA
jgi:hypothetical protein